jgi:hypothetical protein
MSGRAGPSGRNRYAGVGVSVGGTAVAVGSGVAVEVAVGVFVGVDVAVSVGVAVEVAVGDGVAVGVRVKVVVGIIVNVGVNATVRVSVGTPASETTGWGTDVPGPQAPIPIVLRMITIPITVPRFFLIPLHQPFL